MWLGGCRLVLSDLETFERITAPGIGSVCSHCVYVAAGGRSTGRPEVVMVDGGKNCGDIPRELLARPADVENASCTRPQPRAVGEV